MKAITKVLAALSLASVSAPHKQEVWNIPGYVNTIIIAPGMIESLLREIKSCKEKIKYTDLEEELNIQLGLIPESVYDDKKYYSSYTELGNNGQIKKSGPELHEYIDYINIQIKNFINKQPVNYDKAMRGEEYFPNQKVIDEIRILTSIFLDEFNKFKSEEKCKASIIQTQQKALKFATLNDTNTTQERKLAEEEIKQILPHIFSIEERKDRSDKISLQKEELKIKPDPRLEEMTKLMQRINFYSLAKLPDNANPIHQYWLLKKEAEIMLGKNIFETEDASTKTTQQATATAKFE